MKFSIGSTIEDAYLVKKTFGGGGMGLVHLASHLAWNTDVAIKHPRPEFLRSEKQMQDFHAECATWSAIELDPYIATCFYSRELGGLPCVIAEYLPGGSLQDAIHSRVFYRGDEEPCLANLLTMAASSAWGLARAHQSQLLHCDVKPGNMLLTEYGTLKIADFGLAVAFRPALTDAKAKGLTVAFSSPEQLRGGTVSPASDVWSWAASMLSLFAGGVTWESGSACGAALRSFMEEGGKAYRIPAMPLPLAELLTECFPFSMDKRVSSFDLIAPRICEIYEEIFGEACPAQRPDAELVSANSLNNRAVSRFDLRDMGAVRHLLAEALEVDDLHPEANFNTAILDFQERGAFSPDLLKRMDMVKQYDLGDYRPHLYHACLLRLTGNQAEANAAMAKARELAREMATHEIDRLWDLSRSRNLPLRLAPPISGEDLAYDSTRFWRLMDKAETAIQEHRIEDAKRYLLMSGDISGFGRHPRRRQLSHKLKSATML